MGIENAYTVVSDKPRGKILNRWERFWYAWKNALAISTLEVELRRTRELNRDMDAQIRELLKGNPMSEAQLAEITLVRRDNEYMKKQIDILTIYLRTRWKSDFQSGMHAHRGLADIAIWYLGKLEQDAAKAVQSA